MKVVHMTMRVVRDVVESIPVPNANDVLLTLAVSLCQGRDQDC